MWRGRLATHSTPTLSGLVPCPTLSELPPAARVTRANTNTHGKSQEMCDSLRVLKYYPKHSQLGSQHLYYPLAAPNLGTFPRK